MSSIEHLFTLSIAKQASAVTFDVEGRYLAVGSDDGSVRIYEKPFSKVKHAIRNIGSPVAAILFLSAGPAGDRDKKPSLIIYVSAGCTLFKFEVKDRLIYTKEDAVFSKILDNDAEGALNQIALNKAESRLAFTTDSGAVGVLELSTGLINEMKSRHSAIAWTVAFIPERPNELVSGGYDCVLKHFDYKKGTLLSQYQFDSLSNFAPGVMSLPPFVTGTSLSSLGAICAGTADGRIWLGLEGEKEKKEQNARRKTKSKRSRKWNGLIHESVSKRIEEAMIAGVSFVADDEVVACSLYGRVSCHTIKRSEEVEGVDKESLLIEKWTRQCDLEKVDCLATGTNWEDGRKLIAVGGIDKTEKKGSVVLWSIS